MAPLDPMTDFADDGGTPDWRARRAPIIRKGSPEWVELELQSLGVEKPGLKAAFRYLIRHPGTLLALLVALALLPFAFGFICFVLLMLWGILTGYG